MPEVSVGGLLDGRYEVLVRIGSGGMADVWLAEDRHLQRRVALKILHSRFAQDREFVERFRLEAEAAAALQHPNIVGVFDRGAYEGTYYIAMQYVEGSSLKELIAAGLSPEQAVRLVRQVLEGARYAHRHGVVHRDLKPQNVIVDPEGKALVTDFGIARAGVSEITQTGSVMGTPHYFSPEQAQGTAVTAVSDLYSIGVILYEALTQRVPFEGESAVAVAMKQVSQTPQRPSSINPGVSAALDAVAMRALEKDPGQRFQSADAFIAALDAALREPGQAAGTAAFAPLPPPVAAPEQSAAQEGQPAEAVHGIRRRRWLMVLAAALIGAAVGFALTRETATAVPSVTGDQLALALSLLQQDGFPVGEVKRVARSAPENTVLEQDPAASPPAARATLQCSFLTFFCSKPKVALTVSAGPGSARVPSVAGLPEAEAAARLRRAGFTVKVRSAHSATVAAGSVIHAEPPAGSTLTRGSMVTLTVSSGLRMVKVPVLVGQQRSAAVQQIRARGLLPSVSEEASPSPPGEVIRQTPSAGAEVDPGSAVSIVVAKGHRKVRVPNVVGETRLEAVAALREAGLSAVAEERETEAPSQVGHVIDQFPPKGSEIDRGAKVTVVVAKQAPPSAPTTPTPH